MTRERRDVSEEEVERYEEPNFRCPGCEVNNGTGRYCQACQEEIGGAQDYRDDTPKGGWHPPSAEWQAKYGKVG